MKKVPGFHSAREAKEFLISKIVEEAIREGTVLSEIERKMLYFPKRIGHFLTSAQCPMSLTAVMTKVSLSRKLLVSSGMLTTTFSKIMARI